MKKIAKSKLITLMAALLGLAGVSQSRAQVMEDFQNDTVGANPANASYISEPDGGNVEVVDINSTFSDPFGGAGNKSMLIDAAKGAPYISFHSKNKIVSGTFSMDIYADTYDRHNYLRLGNNNGSKNLGSEQTAINFLFRPGSTVSCQVFTGEQVLKLDNVMAHDKVNRLEVTFDSVSKTFSGKLNGEELTANNGQMKTFEYYKSSKYNISSITVVQFYLPVKENSRTFIDKIVLDAEHLAIGSI